MVPIHLRADIAEMRFVTHLRHCAAAAPMCRFPSAGEESRHFRYARLTG